MGAMMERYTKIFIVKVKSDSKYSFPSEYDIDQALQGIDSGCAYTQYIVSNITDAEND